MRRDDDRRDKDAALRQKAHDVDPVHPGHLQVEHDATGTLALDGVEQFDAGRESVHLHVRGLQQAANRCPHRLIVIENCDTRSRRDHRRLTMKNFRVWRDSMALVARALVLRVIATECAQMTFSVRRGWDDCVARRDLMLFSTSQRCEDGNLRGSRLHLDQGPIERAPGA